MSTHPVVSQQSHNPEIISQSHWESILREAGMPAEPHPQRNTVSLQPAAREDSKPRISFFDLHSDEIFEARQDWKRAGDVLCVCVFCEMKFWERKGTKYCCDNHRKRHHEGKVYKKVMCAAEGCSREIPWWVEPAVIDGKNLCRVCAELHRLGFATHAEYLAHYKAKDEEYRALREQQYKKVLEMYR